MSFISFIWIENNFVWVEKTASEQNNLRPLTYYTTSHRLEYDSLNQNCLFQLYWFDKHCRGAIGQSTVLASWAA